MADLSYLTIEHAPNKTVYKVGDKFERYGMIVKAHYDDNTSSNIDFYMVSPMGPLTINDNQITISFLNKSITQNITVNNPPTEGYFANRCLDAANYGDNPYINTVDGSISYYNKPITVERDSYQLNVVLSYHSRMSDKESDLIKGLFKGFRTNYHQFLIKDGKDQNNNDTYKYIDGNGYIHAFIYYSGINKYYDKEGNGLVLDTSASNKTITDLSGNVLTFDTSNRLISIKNGINEDDIKIIEYNSDGLRKIYDSRRPDVYIKFSYNFSFLLYIRVYYNDDDTPLKTYTLNGMMGQISSIDETVGNHTRRLYEYLYNDREKVRRIVDVLSKTAYRLTYDFDATLNDYRFNSIRQGYMNGESLIEQSGIYYVDRKAHSNDPYCPICELIIQNDNQIKLSFMNDLEGRLISTFELEDDNEDNYQSFIKEKGIWISKEGECTNYINNSRAFLYTDYLTINQGLTSNDLDSSKYIKICGYLKIKSSAQRITLYINGSHIYPDIIDIDSSAKNIWQYFEVEIERELNNNKKPISFNSFEIQLINDSGYFVETELANLYFAKSEAKQKLFFVINNTATCFDEIGTLRVYSSYYDYSTIENLNSPFYMSQNDLLKTIKEHYRNSSNTKIAYFSGGRVIRTYYPVLVGEGPDGTIPFFNQNYFSNDDLTSSSVWFFATDPDADVKTYYRFKETYYEIIVRTKTKNNNNQTIYLDNISKYNYKDQIIETRKTFFDYSFNESISTTSYEYFLDGQIKKVTQSCGTETIILYDSKQNNLGYVSRRISGIQGIDIDYDKYLESIYYTDIFYSNGTIARSYNKREISYNDYLDDVSSVAFQCNYDIEAINSTTFGSDLSQSLFVDNSIIYSFEYNEASGTSTFKRHYGPNYDNVISIKNNNSISEITYYDNEPTTIITTSFDTHKRITNQKVNNINKVIISYNSNFESPCLGSIGGVTDNYINKATVFSYNSIDSSLSQINFNNNEFKVEIDGKNQKIFYLFGTNDYRRVTYITDDNSVIVDVGLDTPVSEHRLFYKKDAFDRLIRHYSLGPQSVYLLSDIDYLDGTLLPSGFSFGYSANGLTISQQKYSERYEYNSYGYLSKVYINNSSTPITYASDGFSRIVQESNNPISSYNRHYSYNSKGFLSSFGSTQLSYNSKGQLSSFGDIQFAYDNYGNRLTKGSETYSWTRGKLLNSITKNGNTISFTYDYLGRRYQKLVNGNVVSTYYYLGNRLVGENRSNDLKLRFIYDETGIEGIYAFDSHGRDYYFHYVKNPFGQIVAIVDEEGDIEAKYVYDAWGNHKVLDSLGNEINYGIGVENPFRYKGYYYDDETGLYYLLSRYYDSAIGQFISPDDCSYLNVESISGYHLYAYCNNNPMMLLDESGHEAVWWNPSTWDWGAIGKGIGLVLTGGIAIAVGIVTFPYGGWISVVAGITIIAGGGTVVFGLADAYEGISGYNPIKEGVFLGNSKAYNITENIFLWTAIVGTIVCSSYAVSNTTIASTHSTPSRFSPNGGYLNLDSKVLTYYGKDGIMRYSAGFFESNHQWIHWHLEIGAGISHSKPINSLLEFLYYFWIIK